MERYTVSQHNKPDKPSGPAKSGRSHPIDRFVRQAWVVPALLTGAVVIGLGALVALLISHYKIGSNKPAPAPAAANTPSGNSRGQTAVVTPSISPAAKNSIISAVELKLLGNLSSRYAKRVHVVVTGGINITVASDQVLSYLNALAGAQNPWNWNIPASTLAAWQQGPYGQYFTGNVLVGESSNGYVVSFGFDQNGDISTVFIATNADLLTSGAAGPTETAPVSLPDNPKGVE